MHHLEDLPRVAAGAPPLEALLPAAGAMATLCLFLFLLLFVI